MIRHFLSLAMISLAITSATAQTAAPSAPETVPAPAVAPAPKPATARVALQTGEGRIVLEFEKERAPITTANFLRYVDQKRLDGTAFYRAVKVVGATGLGLVQGGARNGPKRVLPPIKHEPTNVTGLSHVDGTISMARLAPGTASGDFFIIVGDLKSFDADPAQPGDNLGFAAFGHVTEGMDIVRRIMEAQTSATAGAGVMKGQMIANPIRIVTARRIP